MQHYSRAIFEPCFPARPNIVFFSSDKFSINLVKTRHLNIKYAFNLFLNDKQPRRGRVLIETKKEESSGQHVGV